MEQVLSWHSNAFGTNITRKIEQHRELKETVDTGSEFSGHDVVEYVRIDRCGTSDFV
jgi:hypothetical protein